MLASFSSFMNLYINYYISWLINSLLLVDITFTVGDQVIARWTDNLYYVGNVSLIVNGQINVLYGNGDRTTYSIRNISAVVPDQEPHQMQIGQHVMATWRGGNNYFIGYVSDGPDAHGRFKVTFDNNNEDLYFAKKLRAFPPHRPAHNVK